MENKNEIDKGKLVKFIDRIENEMYGICQYLGMTTASHLDRGSIRSMNHYTVTSYYNVFRTGKEQRLVQNSSSTESGDNLQIINQFKSIPSNFLLSKLIKSNHQFIQITMINDDIAGDGGFVVVDENELKNEFPINDLPNTIWPQILSFFRASELLQLITVCKKWNKHIENDYHW